MLLHQTLSLFVSGIFYTSVLDATSYIYTWICCDHVIIWLESVFHYQLIQMYVHSYSFQDLGQTENTFRVSVYPQDPTCVSPDNATFFKPPSCTPTKKVRALGSTMYFILCIAIFCLQYFIHKVCTILGPGRDWRQGPHCCRSKAGQEAHLARRRGGGRAKGWRRPEHNICQLPQEEEANPNEFSEQFFLRMHSNQRGGPIRVAAWALFYNLCCTSRQHELCLF